MEVKTINTEEFISILKKDNINLEDIPELLVNKLRNSKLRITSAESCTGGLISKLITDCSGASEIFDCGICSYSNEIKEKILGVSKESLEAFGAVSAQVAKEMAEGVRKLAGADIAVSTTGIAGPAGGTHNKPVGTVYIAVATSEKTDIYRGEFESKNNPRDKNRQLSAALALYCAFLRI